MRTALRLAAPLSGALIVLVVLLAIRALPTQRTLAIFVVLLTAIALRELVRSVPGNDGRKTAFEGALRRQETTAPEHSAFAAIERELELATAFADHAHNKLLPRLRTAAAARLSKRHGVELERNPDAARRLLGEKTWELLRPDRPMPADSLAPGPRKEAIAAVVAQLENL